MKLGLLITLALILLIAVASSCRHVTPIYESRGKIVVLEKTDQGMSLSILHEPVLRFTLETGEITDLDAQISDFKVTEKIMPSNLKANDLVSFKFTVHWDQRTKLEITQLSVLDSQTKLSIHEPQLTGSGV